MFLKTIINELSWREYFYSVYLFLSLSEHFSAPSSPVYHPNRQNHGFNSLPNSWSIDWFRSFVRSLPSVVEKQQQQQQNKQTFTEPICYSRYVRIIRYRPTIATTKQRRNRKPRLTTVNQSINHPSKNAILFFPRPSPITHHPPIGPAHLPTLDIILILFLCLSFSTPAGLGFFIFYFLSSLLLSMPCPSFAIYPSLSTSCSLRP